MVKKEIVLKDNYELSKPTQMKEMAVVLKEYIVKNKLFVPISGKNYVMVEGWTFAGGLLGLLPIITKTENQGKDNEIKYMATAEIRDKNDRVVSIGVAVCSTKENKKKSFDEYAVLSMSQTRAIGKAYRNLIGWVIKMSGGESTPAEEMVKAGDPIPTVQMDETPAFTSALEKLGRAKTEAELKTIWTKLSAKEKQDDEVVAFKDELKKKLK